METDPKVIQSYVEKVRKEVAENQELIKINESIRTHPVEIIGKELRNSMINMKRII